MLPTIPGYLSLILLAVSLALWSVYAYILNSFTTKKGLWKLGFITLWLVIHSLLAYYAFYQNVSVLPPRLFVYVILPEIAGIVWLFMHTASKKFLDNLNLTMLTAVHGLRAGIEVTLVGIAAHGATPRLLTFEGRNFDLLIGISAIGMAVVASRKKWPGFQMAWHALGILSLTNIFFHSLLAAPFPFQRLAFEQPNIFIFYFPFILIPAFIFPSMFVAHVAALSQLKMVRLKK